MKTANIVYKLKILLAFFALPLLSMHAQQVEKVRNYVKVFDIEPGRNTLVIDADFAHIDVRKHDEQKIVVNSILKASGPANKLEEFLEGWSVEENIEDDRIELNFIIRQYEINLFNNVKFHHQLMILLPENVNMEIRGDYLKISIPELKANLKIDSDFSDLQLGYIHGTENEIKGDYLEADIKYIHSVAIDSDFSEFKMDLNFKLKAEGDHTDYYIKRGKKMEVDGDFIDLQSNRVYKINIDSDNSDFQLKRTFYVMGKGDFNEYDITDLPENFRIIKLHGDYQEVEINNNRGVPYVFEIKLNYGDFKFNGLQFLEKIEKIGKKYYKGFFKSPHAKSVIFMDMDYSEINLKNKNK